MLYLFRVVLFLSAILFCDTKSVSAQQQMSSDIDVVYHIATVKNWKQIVAEQIETLEKSGLGEACDSMTITVVGGKVEEVQDMFTNLSFYSKVNIIDASLDLHQYEFPGIDAVIRIAAVKPNAKILYIHSKGVTHYQTASEQPVRYWRRYLEYFTVTQWQDCVKALDYYDVCGVDWTLSISGLPFFAGNFWWSRASYILTCHLNHTNRFDCEAFIGTGTNPIAKSFHQSGENPKLTSIYTYAQFPQFFHFPPSNPYHRGIMNLYSFCYLDEYYREPN